MWELRKWQKAIGANGFRKTLHDWWIYGDIKTGKLVGKDAYGNRYYQNKNEIVWGIFIFRV
jgi:NADH:ubiquinone oxidoreductase subunit